MCVGVLTSCDVYINDSSEYAQEDYVTVSFIDVGQGDCILIQTDESNVLIDAGESENAETVEQYLTDNGVETLDYIVATHPHSDHIGALPKIITDMNVEHILQGKMSDDIVPTTRVYEKYLTAIADKGLTITSAVVGDVYDLGNAQLEIVAPNSDDYSDLNDISVVTILTHGDNKFIFTGDASKRSEKEMLQNGLLEDVDVLKVGHHGSDTATTQEFLDAITPEIAVIMCGVNNKYGHPCEETMDKLYDANIEVYRTDEEGTIHMVSNGSTIETTTEK